jgi:NAD(P)-dependent dehydrogenase (short-subunit alcohol dehydrogenase family)
MKLSKKKVIVFGGTSGIGSATIKIILKEGASKVYAISRAPNKLKIKDKRLVLEKLDVLDENLLKKLFKKIGSYDVLISTATGGERAIGPFLKMNMQGYRNSFDKLWGYANVIRYGVKTLKKSGTIVLVSGSPARKPKPGFVAISSAGGAVEAFVRAITQELSPIRINLVSPGVIDTPMNTLKGKERLNFFKNATKDNIIKRAGSPEEVAKAIIFAIENEFITGTTIDIDGGWILS